MKISPAKENILKKIRQALSNPVPVPFPNSEGTDSLFRPGHQELAIEFAENFTKLQGRFSFCNDEKELIEQLQTLIKVKALKNIYCRENKLTEILSENGLNGTLTSDLKSCDVSITSCEKLIARTGSIVMSSAQQSGRATSVYAPIHVCIAYSDQVVYDIREALTEVKEKYEQLPSLITLATGPSRTADIEKTLVVGVHGPKEVFCFFIDRS
jgi:L-lactate dehydrogenase complex protein LldG